MEGRVTAPMSDDDVRRLREAVNEGREWRHATPTPEFLEVCRVAGGFPGGAPIPHGRRGSAAADRCRQPHFTSRR